LNEPDKAEPLYTRALSIREKALGPEHANVATGLNNLAGLYMKLNEPDKALPLYTRALSTMEKAYGTEDPRVAAIRNNLTMLCNR